MFFEVNITPKENAPHVHTDIQVKFNLILAPFQPQTRIRIETPLNTTAQCYLYLRNPSGRPLNVQVTKKPPAERSVSLSLSQLTIEPDRETELIISWTARKPGTFRDIIQLTDSRRIKYDVALTTSTISSKKIGNGSKLQENTQPMGQPAKKVCRQIISPKKKSEPKGCLNSTDNFQSSNNRHTSSFPSKYRGKENVCTHPAITWETPKKRTSAILEHRQEKSSDISDGKLRDFSMLMESDIFALTPLARLKNNDQLEIETQSSENYEFSKQSYTTLSCPSNSENQELRRATYTTTAPIYKNATFTNEDMKHGFEDSLSPQEPKSITNPDFSMLVNNLNFASTDTPTAAVVANTENNLQVSQLPSARQFATPTSTANDTFEVIRSSGTTESLTNSINSTTSIDIHRLLPTRLSRNFAKLSPVMPVVEPCITKYAMSSSPICENELGELSAISRSRYRLDGFNLPSRQSDLSSVQDVLEADLWAKPLNQFSFTAVKSGPLSLESIREETAKTSPVTNKTYVKCWNKTQTTEIVSTPISFRSEFSPPKNNHAKKTSPFRKISPKKFSKISKDKSTQEIHHLKKKATINTSLKSRGKVTIPGVRVTRLSLAGVARPMKNSAGSNRGFEKEVSMKLHDPDDFFARLCNPDPFAASTTEDPFLSSTLYYDDQWVHNQELEFKKWLNALLTPPEHLTSDVDTPLVDVAKVWQSCRLKEDVSLAESKEAVSARYHTNQRLNTLRRAACTMLRNNEVVTVLSRITVCVEKGNLLIRQDRDLHKDIGLQKLVLELLLCYNPLWLRIGLEAIYGETIPLNSNSDVIRLSKFLLTRFFSDPYIVKTHSHQTISNIRLPTFLPLMNKFILKKFLFLIYFLDYAKIHKLIGHDPCLFHKQAAHKESRRILLKFSQELLSGVGDVTRVLKPYGYVLIHKQTELDEYSYAVDNLSHDLRDGVRLCRVIELITGKRNLTAICRVPAISRLQKVYNVDVALRALTSSGYTVCGNITAKCIADGHREKTLSLLWQIIYKFQAPHFNRAAKTIQKWFRSKLWWIRVKNYLLKRKNNAACVIQRAWRSYIAKKKLKSLREQHARILSIKNQAARIIQLKWIATVKTLRERKHFQRFKSASITIQRSWRNYQATKSYRTTFKHKQAAVRIIQQRWRATKSKQIQMTDYLIIRDAIIKIQIWWKWKLVQMAARNRFIAIQKATRLIQSTWRANCLMKVQRNEYLKNVRAVIVIQEWWRCELACRKTRNDFLVMKDAVHVIENWWIHHSTQGKLLNKEINAAITIQRRWRAIQLGRQQRNALEMLKQCVLTVQRRWRANKLAKYERQSYILKRNATILIQSYWRNWRAVYEQRCAFISLKAAAICIQDRVRANKAARKASEDFNKLKQSVVILQRRWRAMKIGKQTRREFINKRKAAIVIQKNYKMIIVSRRYQSEKRAALKIQLWWKALLLAKETKYNYDQLKRTAIFVQRKYRAQKLGTSIRLEFIILKTSINWIQQKWRAKKLMQLQRKDFLAKRQAAITIQSWWRACLTARKTKLYYHLLYITTIYVQRKYRAKRLSASIRQEFVTLKNSVIYIQQKWKANQCRKDFLAKRQAVIQIQNWWRAITAARICQQNYTLQRIAAIRIQIWYRSIVEDRTMREIYNKYITSIISIQRWWREILFTRQAIRNREMSAAKIIQAVWRGYRVRQTQSLEMAELRQRSVKAAMEAQPTDTLAHRLKTAIIIMQEYENLGKLTQGLTALDTITHLLPQGCIALCKANLVGKLYDLLHRANRSRPWMDICCRASSILVSITKYSPTKHYAWQEEYIETLVRLLSSTVERETSVFLNLATLLWLLADTPDRIQAIVKSPSSARSLSTLYNTLSKKRTKISSSLKLPRQTCVLPNPEPDWGLKHSRPRLFMSVHHAVASLCKRLKIKVTMQ